MTTSNLFGYWIYLINMSVIQVVMRQLFFCFENVLALSREWENQDRCNWMCQKDHLSFSDFYL